MDGLVSCPGLQPGTTRNVSGKAGLDTLPIPAE